MRVDKTKCEISTLGNICTLKTGKKDANHADENGCYPFFTCGASPLKANTYSFEGANLIIPGNGDIGRCFYYNGKIEAYQRTYVLHLKENSNIDIKYLYAVFKANWKPFIQNKILGVAMPYIKLGHLNSFPIPIYDLSVQQSIVSELDAIQTMIDGYKAQLEDLDALAQSIFLDMFGDPVSNPKGWEKKELRELGVISSGGTPLRSNPVYYKGDIDWYSAGELNHLYLNGSNEKITKEAIKESSAKLFKANSLFIGLYDTAAFKLGITLKEASANQACANLFPIKDNVIWIYYCLLNMKEYAWNFRKGIRQKNLSVGFIKSFSVPLPLLSLQQQFARKIESIEQQKELIRFQLKDTETLMAERMQYYFS